MRDVEEGDGDRQWGPHQESAEYKKTDREREAEINRS